MSAVFSPGRVYRYTLVREFIHGKGTVVFILLNPSTADETHDDPTVRRCIGYAKRWGFRKLIVVNIFALRSTDPDALYNHKDPVGPENDRWILEACRGADLVVAGWGVHGALRGRGREVALLLKDVEVFCLGKTKRGEPCHPLYLSSNASLVKL